MKGTIGNWKGKLHPWWSRSRWLVTLQNGKVTTATSPFKFHILRAPVNVENGVIIDNAGPNDLWVAGLTKPDFANTSMQQADQQPDINDIVESLGTDIDLNLGDLE